MLVIYQEEMGAHATSMAGVAVDLPLTRRRPWCSTTSVPCFGVCTTVYVHVYPCEEKLQFQGREREVSPIGETSSNSRLLVLPASIAAPSSFHHHPLLLQRLREQ